MDASTSNSTPPKPPPDRFLRTKPACCACKHQRRRCTPECPLAAYFPPEKIKDFQNVHKLFGIHNVVNLLKKIPPHYREDAVKSLCYEAHFRAVNPVGGCCLKILELQKQILYCTSQLEAVQKHLSLYKPSLYDDQIGEVQKHLSLYNQIGESNLEWEKMYFRNTDDDGPSFI